MKKWLFWAFAFFIACISPDSSSAQVVYSHDFETDVGAEWSHSTRSTTPLGGRQFLGEFNNDTVTLTLTGLPPHTRIYVRAMLFIIRTWDVDGGDGPDIFRIAADGQTLFSGTITGVICGVGRMQNYPVTGQLFPCGTGVSEHNSLGYQWNNVPHDGVYIAEYSSAHTSDDVVISFSASGLQTINDESWGIDNIRIELANEDAPPPNCDDTDGTDECLFSVGETVGEHEDLWVAATSGKNGCTLLDYGPTATSEYLACRDLNTASPNAGADGISNNGFFHNGFTAEIPRGHHTLPIPRYLYKRGDDADIRFHHPLATDQPVETSKLTLRFDPGVTLPNPAQDVTFQVLAYGTEVLQIHAGSSSTYCMGINEGARTRICQIVSDSPQAVTDYAIEYVANQLGAPTASNGNYVVAYRLIDSHALDQHFYARSTAPGPYELKNPDLAPFGEALFSLGEQDSYSQAQQSNLYDEFISEGFVTNFTYRATEEPSQTRDSVNFPGALASGQVTGVGTAQSAEIHFNAAKNYSALKLYLSFLGAGPVGISLDNVAVATWPGAGQSTQLVDLTLTNVRAGAHVLKLSSAALPTAPVYLDWIALFDPDKSDWDKDGLADLDEKRLLTKAAHPDSDGDGIMDGQEVGEGSDPLDYGSANRVVRDNICLEWNGFLGMWNVVEAINRGAEGIAVTARLKSAQGVEQGSPITLNLAANAQYDLLVHDLPGFKANEIGTVCLEQVGGVSGDLQAKMMFYRPAPPAGQGQAASAQSGFEFAIGMEPWEVPGYVPQILPVNTFDPQNRGNLVANWLQLTWAKNEGDEERTLSGRILLRDELGLIIRQLPFTLSNGERLDFPGHDLGVTRVGTAQVEFDVLDNSEVAKERLTFRNARYYYDGSNAFLSALTVPGLAGTGQEIYAPVDTRSSMSVVELISTSDEGNDIRVEFYQANGQLKASRTISLLPRATQHLIVNDIVNSANFVGMVKVKGAGAQGTTGTVMQYLKDSTGRLLTSYVVPLREAYGKRIGASYNTFLGQGCRLVLFNTGQRSTAATLSVYNSSGELLSQPENIALAAKGTSEFDVCKNIAPNRYGAIELAFDSQNTVAAHLLRVGKNSEYLLAFPLR